jgi:YHS domain-containing protein
MSLALLEFRKMSRRATLGAIMLSVVAISPIGMGQALAYDESSTSAVNVDAGGVAIRGYDPVAYFTLGKPAVGDKQYSATFGGARYLFTSAANRDKFLADPARYSPVFGGFCAMGVALGKKLDGDPTLWRVVDGKLYLNVAKPAQTRWLEDIPGNLAKANATWPNIQDKAPTDL